MKIGPLRFDSRPMRRWIGVAAFTAVNLAPGWSLAAVAGCPIDVNTHTESWKVACDAAIAKEVDPQPRAQLHYRRAYSLNEQQRYQDALSDLDAALTMHPHNSQYLHERGYTRNALGDYAGALTDLNEQADLQPNEPSVYQERAFARHRLGDLSGALKDRERVVSLSPNSMDAVIGRAVARFWVGQFTEARDELEVVLKQARESNNEEDEEGATENLHYLEVLTRHSEGPAAKDNCAKADQARINTSKTLIGDCTLAFLAATTSKEKADALTIRAIAWVLESQRYRESVNDNEIAAALDPNNPDMHTNLGFAYLQNRHSWGALQEFDRSIAIQKTFLALAGRASAHFNLGDKNAAFADARASFDIKPNEAALIVLGDLAAEKKHMNAARSFWMGAYHLGARDDDLIKRLKDAGVKDPAKE